MDILYKYIKIIDKLTVTKINHWPLKRVYLNNALSAFPVQMRSIV